MFNLEHWVGFIVAAAIPAVVFAVWTKRTYFSDSTDGTPSHAPIYPASNDHPTIDFTLAGLLLDMKDKWARPLTKLPVNVDIPRLAHKMSIYDEKGELLLDGGWLDLTPEEREASPFRNKIPSWTSNVKLIQEVLRVLAEQLGEDQQVIIDEFDNMVKENGGDTSGPFGNFLNKHLGDASKVVKVLKACNQSILAPSVVRLKLSIAPRLPFKDLRGAWRIRIHCLRDSVIVFHRKQETSWYNFVGNEENKEEFQFSWQLRIEFDKDMSVMRSIDVSVTEIEFDKSVTEERKREVLNIMGAYYNPSADLRLESS